jgi:DNA-binding LacI/PurR family transcriptional regulator
VTTIYDIAKAAGVTAATVSNVLSGKRVVSAATRERVMKYVHELGYRPNLVARSLIRQSTRTIGLFVPNIGNPFFAGLAEAAERIAYAAGFRIFVTNTYRDEQLTKNLLDDLLSRRVDGIIVVSELFTFVESLQTLHLPSCESLPLVVCLWEEKKADFVPSITFDFHAAGRLATEHLLALGHERIGVVVSGLSSEEATEGQIHHTERLAGFEEALRQHGHQLDRSLLRIGNSTLESGKSAGCQLLQLPEPPTAIFATNDMMAIGVLSAAWELGIRVPDQLSVVGFDDIHLAAYQSPPLTTVIMRESAVAERALRLLFRMIEGEQVTSPPMLQPELVVRGSTAPPADRFPLIDRLRR